MTSRLTHLLLQMGIRLPGLNSLQGFLRFNMWVGQMSSSSDRIKIWPKLKGRLSEECYKPHILA
jgi:hypothetical protein